MSPRLIRICLLTLASLSLTQTLWAQKGGSGGGRSNNIPSNTPPSMPNVPSTTQPLFISGRVLLKGGGAPGEPVIIERVCNGSARREGYSDSKGQFQFQLGQNQIQDASESAGTLPDNSRSRRGLPGSTRMTLDGCEMRAVLAGFTSSSVPLRMENDFDQLDVGTIMLTRMGNVEGSTISATSMAAPKDAQQALDKGRKAGAENKFEEAEKQLNKAIRIYPQYAAAWSLMGELHRLQNNFEQAEKDYEQAIQIDPKFVNPYFGLSLIAVTKKKWMETARLTDQLIKLNAMAYPLAYYYNAAANYNTGNTDLAEQSARKYQSIDTQRIHSEVAVLLGNILVT